jgi:hypothetical protein
MLESSFFLYLVLLFYGAGRAFLCLVRWQHKEFLFTLSSSIGVIVITLAMTWYYRLGGRLNHFFWIVSIIVGSFLIWWLICHIKILRSIADARLELLAGVGFSVLALLPGILGGEQFVIFRGNEWDSFNYLQSAMTYQTLPYARVDHLNAAELVDHGCFQFGHDNLLYRPEVTFLYGMLSSYHLKAFLRLHYFLLVYFQFLAFFAVRALAAELLPSRRVIPFLLAAAIVGGFWGQYILDIDAWSQISCMPLIVLSLLLLIKLTQTTSQIESRYADAKLIIIYALIWVGMFYLYPEAAGFILPAHAICLIVAICFLKVRVNWRFVGLVALAAGALLLPVTKSNLAFLLWQAARTMAGFNWWIYFQAFLFGQGGMNHDFFSKTADFIAGALGIYFVTPVPGTEPLMAVIVRTLVIVGATVLIVRLTMGFRSLLLPSWSLVISHLGVSLTCILAYCLLRQYWLAGKALSFIAYFVLLVLIASPFRKSASDRTLLNRIAVPVATSLLVLQLAFFCYRPFASRNAFGIHYSAPYPVAQTLKKTINFADWSFLRDFKPTDKIGIQTEDRFVQCFARMLLHSHRIKFSLAAPAFDAKGYPGSEARTRSSSDVTAWLGTAKSTEEGFLLKWSFQRKVDRP